LEERLGEADFVILTMPATPDTVGMFNTGCSRGIPDFHRPSRAVSLRIHDGNQMVAARVVTVTLPRGTFR